MCNAQEKNQTEAEVVRWLIQRVTQLTCDGKNCTFPILLQRS